MDRTKLLFRNNCEGYFIDENSNVLARKSEQGFVIFPGGGIDEDEKVEDGMIRETFEETGAKIKNLKFLGKIKMIWGENWAKTEKQKKRYEKYQGDDMHFFCGNILEIVENKGEEDYWKENKLIPITEAIKIIERNNSDESTKKYRQMQLKFLKQLIDENTLAIYGGKKIVNSPAPHYKWPEITKEIETAVINQLHESVSIYDCSGIIKDLECKFSEIHGVKHSLLTNSGTMALFSMFYAIDLKKGEEIICPAYTFHATASPIFFTGAKPVLADCNKYGNIDPEDIKKKITKKTKAIIITHMWGIPCDMDEIVKIAKENNLILLEDCSHAHFAKYKNKLVGTFGDAAVFSLQGQKTLTGGEGGILLTNNDEIFNKSLLLGHYNKRCKKEIPENNSLYKYFLTGMGLKLRIHPLAAAIAYEQLKSIKEILENRNLIAKKLLTELKDLPGIKLPEFNDKEPTWYAFVMQYKPEELGGLSFEKFYSALLEEGCLEMDHPGSTMPLNLTELFQNPNEIFPEYELNYKEKDFPNAELFYKNALKLPVWHRKEDLYLVELYIKAIKKVIKNYKQLLER